MGRERIVFIALLSLCVHEAAHAMAAKRLGYPVERIEIQPFGFVARLDTRFASTGDAAAIYAAGPVASLSLAAASSLAEGLFPVYAAAGLGLTEFNLVIAAVNLLPALPLDGGRLLLTAFAGRGRRAALRALKTAGILTGAAFLTFSALLVARGAFNPTLAVMGAFLTAAALRERDPDAPAFRRTRIGADAAMPVRAVAVSEETSLNRALRLLPAGCYAVISVVDGTGKRIAELDGERLIEAASVLGAYAKVGEAVALYRREMI